MLVDSHCHLDFPDFAPERDAVVARARAAGVGRNADHLDPRRASSHAIARWPSATPDVFFTVGTHPHQAAEEPDVAAETLVALSRHPRCVGIGEAGLDYHYGYSPQGRVASACSAPTSRRRARPGCRSSSTRATPTRT